ncbi:hypothetical protein [Aliivibrio sifiae]|uniref:Uncharacterized protein n=1 Tax=Aliivibrio sifiae TaxID=566293 RepID=A0A2S7XFE5_9GAMM|nr:hypothetical protein [Aliivibrio sifiae]PQJ89892.1 hypothetical protein BTO22_09985 [Aliivibrio sifiae]
MSGRMVLTSSLLILYEMPASNPKKYKRLMKRISLPYKTNKKQWVEAKTLGLNVVDYQRVLSQLANLSDKDDDLERLASKTILKIILTEESNPSLPYVNFKTGMIKNELIINLLATDDRTNLIGYLQMLCSTANTVTICDNYFANNWDNTQRLFTMILPRHKLKIKYVETPENIIGEKNSSKITQTFVSGIYNDWTVEQCELYKGSHDRYLKIESPEGTVELMISSGFDHIWKNNPKEITCVCRVIE